MYLTIDQLEEIVQENLYSFTGNPFKSKTSSGSYTNNSSLPALSLPGGDMGELAILYSAAFTYGFEVDYDKSVEVLAEMVGGVREFTYKDTISHPLESYNYFHYMFEDPEAYNLDLEGLESYKKHLAKLQVDIPALNEKQLHPDNALILLNCEDGLQTQYKLHTYEGEYPVRIMTFHKYLVDMRHHEYAKKLLDTEAVKLYNGLDHEYLYEVISETTDVHLYETVAKIDPKLPIFSLSISPKGKITLEQFR